MPVNLLIEEGTVYSGSEFLTGGYIKYRKLNFSKLYSLVGNDTNNILIPIINFRYNIQLDYPSMFPHPPQKNVHIELAILIFQNKKLVYFSSSLFSTESVDVYKFEESIDYTIKQENIDTLVQLTMKDYLELMK